MYAPLPKNAQKTKQSAQKTKKSAPTTKPIECTFPYRDIKSYTAYVRDEVIPVVTLTYGNFGKENHSRKLLYTGPADMERLEGVKRLYNNMPETVCHAMHIVGQAGDGTCLFHALGFIVGIDGIAMRAQICNWYANSANALDLEQFNSFLPRDAGIDSKYIENMRRPATYGSGNEILVFTRIYNLKVVIYDRINPCIYTYDSINIRDFSYNKAIILCYSGFHYDSLIPYDKDSYHRFINKYIRGTNNALSVPSQQNAPSVPSQPNAPSVPSQPNAPSVPSQPSAHFPAKPASPKQIEAIIARHSQAQATEREFLTSLYTSNKKALQQSNVADRKIYDALFEERYRKDLESVNLKYENLIDALSSLAGGAGLYNSRLDVPEIVDHRMQLLIGKYNKYTNRLQRLNRIKL